MWQNCNFMNNNRKNDNYNNSSSTHGNNKNYQEYQDEVVHNKSSFDPFNRNIIGPRSCEYCGAPTTLQCIRDCDHPHSHPHAKCQRPSLFFERKQPPFEDEGQKHRGRRRRQEYWQHQHHHHHHHRYSFQHRQRERASTWDRRYGNMMKEH